MRQPRRAGRRHTYKRHVPNRHRVWTLRAVWVGDGKAFGYVNEMGHLSHDPGQPWALA